MNSTPLQHIRNMPVRMLLYIAEEYKRLFDSDIRLLHRKALIKIPEPEFYIIYTGEDTCPGTMYLSDAYETSSGFPELKADVICSPSSGGIISEFISLTKEITALIKQTHDRNASVRTVVNKYKYRPYRISDFLNKRGDVEDMICEGITLEEVIRIREEEIREEGMKQGIIAVVDTAMELGQTLEESIHIAASRFDISGQKIKRIYLNKNTTAL